MSEEFYNDFTDDDVIDALDRAGLRHDDHNARYIVSQCPRHDERNPSCQIFRDDWFALCHSGCGRFPISDALPGLKRRRESAREGGSAVRRENTQVSRSEGTRATQTAKYKTFELYDEWASMPPIPRDHRFKTIPLSVLDRLGWRYEASHNRYYIPYFTESRDSVPFMQWRNLEGNVRFNFLKDGKPTVYGKWNLTPGKTYFMVEGTSDCATLEHCGIPWVGIPSSSLGEMVKSLGAWCVANRVRLIYAGDNDEAGDKLKAALEEVMPFRTCQPPARYNDWSDFLVAEGPNAVIMHAAKKYGPLTLKSEVPDGWGDMSDIQKLREVFPGATELQIV